MTTRASTVTEEIPHRIHIEFATLNDDNKFHKAHRYGSYSKSILPHHENDNPHSDDIENELSDKSRKRKKCCCLSPCFSSISYYLPILHPFGPFRCFWDFLVMAMLIYTCIEVPVTLAFNVSLEIDHFAGIIAFIIDILLMFDVAITFRTAYFDKFDRLRLIIDECEIAKRYIFGWFFIDLITSIPFEFMLPTNSSVVKVVKVFRVFRFIRIVKILRLIKMIKYFDGFMSQFVIRELLIVLKFLKILALMILFAHLSACSWFFVGYATMNSDSGSWVSSIISEDRAYIDNLPTFEKYSYSWYWAVVTLFTTGYGDIVATKGNLYEEWLVSICILVGTCFFAYFIGTLTSLITEGDRIKSVEIQKLEEAQAFCDHKKLPRELSRAILTHIRYHCGYNYVFDESELISSLPPYLQNDIHSYLAQTILMQIDIFKSLKKSPQILGQIALKMRSISCNENYCLYKKGDRAKELYIQRTGESILDYEDGQTRILKRGDVIGEQSIISPKRKTTVTCFTFSEFYILSVQDMIAVLQTEYPSTWHKRWKKIDKALRESNKLNKKQVRSVDFNRYRTDEHLIGKDDPHQHEHVHDVNNSSVHSHNAWMSAPSTIKTTRLPAVPKGEIKSVQLNSIGEVETPLAIPVNGDHGKYDEDQKDNNNPFKLINDAQKTYPKSDGDILQKKNNNNNGKNNSASDSKSNEDFLYKNNNVHRIGTNRDLPQFKSSKSQPVLTNINNASNSYQSHPHKKSKIQRKLAGFLVRRNSSDRDNAIHKRAAKRKHVSSTTPRYANPLTRGDTFYEQDDRDSTFADTSDDSADIVPHDHDYEDDEPETIDRQHTTTTTERSLFHRAMSSAHIDILEGVDNMGPLFKQLVSNSSEANTPNAPGEDTKFSAKDRSLTTMERVDTNRRPKPMPIKVRRKTAGAVGGRKKGKFGGAKRRAHTGGGGARKVNVNMNMNMMRKKGSEQRHKKKPSSPHLRVNSGGLESDDKNTKDFAAIDSYSITNTASITQISSATISVTNTNHSNVGKMHMHTTENQNEEIASPVDQMIMSDVALTLHSKISKDKEDLQPTGNPKMSIGALSDTQTEIVYDSDVGKGNGNRKHVKFKVDEIDDEIKGNDADEDEEEEEDEDEDEEKDQVMDMDHLRDNAEKVGSRKRSSLIGDVELNGFTITNDYGDIDEEEEMEENLTVVQSENAPNDDDKSEEPKMKPQDSESTQL